MRLARSIFIAGAVLGPSVVAAQSMPARRAGVVGVELAVRERWIHQRQLPGFTPFSRDEATFWIDSVATADGRRTSFITLGNGMPGNDRAVVVTDGAGRTIVSQHRPRVDPPIPFPNADSQVMRAMLARSSDVVHAIAGARLWDLVPSFHPRALRVNERWVDTLHQRSGDSTTWRRLDGVRVSRLVRDSVANGHTYWVVRDSARVTFAEAWWEVNNYTPVWLPMTRRAAGTIVGTYLFDPSIAMARWREDTTRLAGRATFHDIDGDTLRSAVRFERTRRWVASPTDSLRVAQMRRSDERSRRRGGMVTVVENDTVKRIAAGDTVLREALLAQWRAAREVEERDHLEGLLASMRVAPGFDERLMAMRLAAGDTLRWMMTQAVPPYEGRYLEVGNIRTLLDAMSRPEWLFQLGAGARGPEEQLLFHLSYDPLSVADPRRSPCRPDACAYLAAQWPGARMARVRDLALAMRAALDPMRYADTLRSLARRGHPRLVRMARMFDGDLWAARDGPPRPIPAAGSEWHAWVEWLGELPSATTPTLMPRPTLFQASEIQRTLRIYRAAHRRDLASEIRASLRAAPNDSARLAYGLVRVALGDTTPLDSLAGAIRHGSFVEVRLAQEELILRSDALIGEWMFTGSRDVPPSPGKGLASDRAAVQLADSLVAIVVAHAPMWKYIDMKFDSTTRLMGRRVPPDGSRPAPKRYLQLSALPPAVAARWGATYPSISSADWNEIPTTVAAQRIEFQPVLRMGPFVIVGFEITSQSAREEGAPRTRGASWSSYVLMEWDGEWVVVRMNAAIT